MMEKQMKSNNLKRIIGAVLIVGAFAVVLFTGSVQASLEESSLVVKSRTASITIPYEDIDGVKLLTALEPGSRSFGAETVKVLTGTFSNAAYGTYKLFIYKKVPLYIEVSYNEDEIAVFNLESEQNTQECYKQLYEKIG